MLVKIHFISEAAWRRHVNVPTLGSSFDEEFLCVLIELPTTVVHGEKWQVAERSHLYLGPLDVMFWHQFRQ